MTTLAKPAEAAPIARGRPAPPRVRATAGARTKGISARPDAVTHLQVGHRQRAPCNIRKADRWASVARRLRDTCRCQTRTASYCRDMTCKVTGKGRARICWCRRDVARRDRRLSPARRCRVRGRTRRRCSPSWCLRIRAQRTGVPLAQLCRLAANTQGSTYHPPAGGGGRSTAAPVHHRTLAAPDYESGGQEFESLRARH